MDKRQYYGLNLIVFSKKKEFAYVVNACYFPIEILHHCHEIVVLKPVLVSVHTAVAFLAAKQSLK